MSKPFYTPTSLAEYFQIPKTTIWKMIRQGKFKGTFKIGKHYRIPIESVEEFEKLHIKKPQSGRSKGCVKNL